MVKKVECAFCNKKFHKKGVLNHERHCKSKPLVSATQDTNQTQTVYLEGKNQGFQDAKHDQQFRGKDAIIALSESITKLNQAFAQVVGEWRF